MMRMQAPRCWSGEGRREPEETGEGRQKVEQKVEQKEEGKKKGRRERA